MAKTKTTKTTKKTTAKKAEVKKVTFVDKLKALIVPKTKKGLFVRLVIVIVVTAVVLAV